MMRRTRLSRSVPAALVAVWLLAPGGSGPALAGSQGEVSDQEVKAAMLVQFARFVEWPADRQAGGRSGPLVIGVLQADAVGEHLARIVKTRMVSGAPVVVRPALSAGEATDRVDLLFIGTAGESLIPAVLESIGRAGVLTVSDAHDFVGRGGMIGLREDRERIGFDVNLASAERAQLRISSKLLSLARTVVRVPGETPP